MIRSRLCLIAAAATSMSLAGLATADAHLLAGQSHGMASGLLHPLTGIDHLLAMLAVGVLASRLGGRATWALPACSLIAMLAGAIVGVQGLVMPMLEPGILVSLVLLGVLAFGWLRPGIAPAFVLTGLVAIWHGNAHTHDVIGTGSAVAFMAGIVVTSGVLQTVGIGVGILTRGLAFWRAGLPNSRPA
jgi:urease accessory protein